MLIIACILVLIYKKLLKPQNKLLNQLFYDPEIFPELKLIDEYKDDIIIDLKLINKDAWKFWPEKELYGKPDGEWKIFPFMGFGMWLEENCKKMPSIYKFLKNVPNLKLATLSKMSPKMHLTPHEGWGNHSNNVLRCHYGLEVPENCYIAVKDKDNGREEKQYHKNNSWIVFDDSKTHWAVNNSDKERLVLIIDIERPKFVKPGASKVGDTKELQEILKYFKQFSRSP